MLYQLSYTRKMKQLNRGEEPPLSIPMVGVVGFEPTQLKAPDLQSGPALLLRRTPLYFKEHSTIMSQQRDSNPRPADYKSAALPTELCWLLMPGAFPIALLRSLVMSTFESFSKSDCKDRTSEFNYKEFFSSIF
jgi:hypothetical protein